jgi:hypothetical protein
MQLLKFRPDTTDCLMILLLRSLVDALLYFRFCTAFAGSYNLSSGSTYQPLNV